jgi:hypothetical protein
VTPLEAALQTGEPICMSVEQPNPGLGQGDNQNNLDKPRWGAKAIGEEINEPSARPIIF